MHPVVASAARELLNKSDSERSGVLADTTGLELVHVAPPELRTLGLLDPDAEDLLVAVGQDTERDVPRLIADKPFVPNLHPDRVEGHQRTAGVERATLPLGDCPQNRIGDRRDQVLRHVDPVALLEVPADLTHRHAAHGHRHDRAVEVGTAALVLAISFGAKIPDRSPGTSGVDVY